jgi:hypothetical protein
VTINPFFNFITQDVKKPTDALLVWDVDLAIQDSMSTDTTFQNREDMWELFQRTDGGVIFFTGRTHQSVQKTFGHDYAGAFEHYSTARFGHGHDIVFMSPQIDTKRMGSLADSYLREGGKLHIAETPDYIRRNSNAHGQDEIKAVYVEVKNTSVALVHTTTGQEGHKDYIRSVLRPVGERILKEMGLSETHQVKAGNDAVEMVPKALSNDITTGIGLPQTEIDRIVKNGLGKGVAVHNFMSLFPNRTMMITGDGKPDLEAMKEAKDHFGGKGVFVSNGHPISEGFERAVDHTLDRHTMTWGLIHDTVVRLKEAAPIVKLPLRSGGPSFNHG